MIGKLVDGDATLGEGGVDLVLVTQELEETSPAQVNPPPVGSQASRFP